MELLELYKSILLAMDFTVSEEGLVSFLANGEREPVFVDDRRLVLPTREILREGLGDQRVGFHPVEENFVAKNESPVLRTVRRFATYKLTVHTSRLLIQLMKLAVEPERHSGLTPRQSEFLSHVPDVTRKTLVTLEKLLRKINPATNHDLINLYIRMGGELKGVKYHRLGVVSFPLLNDLEDVTGAEKNQLVEEIYGVKPARKLDFPMIKALLLYVFPGGKETATYSYGSNDQTAPAFDALMHAFLNVANRINHIVKIFKEVLEDQELSDYHELLIDTRWDDAIDNLAAYKGQIPPLSGNSVPASGPMVESPPPVAAEPETGGFEFNYNPQPPKPATSPIYGQPPQVQPSGYGQVIPAIEVETDKEVDFASLKAHNARVMAGGTVGHGVPATPMVGVGVPGQPVPYGMAPVAVAAPGMVPMGTPGYYHPQQTGMMAAPAPMMPMAGTPEWMTASVPGVTMQPMAAPVPGNGVYYGGPVAQPPQRVSTATRYAAAAAAYNPNGGFLPGYPVHGAPLATPIHGYPTTGVGVGPTLVNNGQYRL